MISLEGLPFPYGLGGGVDGGGVGVGLGGEDGGETAVGMQYMKELKQHTQKLPNTTLLT